MKSNLKKKIKRVTKTKRAKKTIRIAMNKKLGRPATLIGF